MLSPMRNQEGVQVLIGMDARREGMPVAVQCWPARSTLPSMGAMQFVLEV